MLCLSAKTSAAELGRQQAEVLGVGRLVKKSQITEQEAPVEALPPQVKSQEEATLDAVLDNFLGPNDGRDYYTGGRSSKCAITDTKVDEIPVVDEIEMTQAPSPTENVEIPVIEEEEEIMEMSMSRSNLGRWLQN